MTSESRDGQGAADHDQPFTFGNAGPAVACMPIFDRMHLMVMRGKIQDYRDGIRGGAADGDLSYVDLKDGKLWVPPNLKP